MVTLSDGTASGSVDDTVGVRLPGDTAVELANVLVLNASVSGEVDGD